MISEKQNPSFYELSNGCLKKVSAKKFGTDFEMANFNSTNEQLTTTKDLAEALRTYLNDYNDTLIINTGDESSEAQRLLRYETNAPILKATPSLCAKLKLETGKYYCYYKPGYVNGFSSFGGQDIDFAYLQACEGICRDEFVPDASYLNGEEYK